MKQSKFTKILLTGVMTMALMSTSIGGAFAASVQAAALEQEESATVAGNKNNAVVGLVAIGLIAAMMSNGGSEKGSSAGGSTQSSTTNPPVTTVPKTTPTSSSASGLTADEQKALNLLNADRAANGLKALKANSALNGLAENYAQDMINRGFFSHYNPEGKSPFDRMQSAGISYSYAGENLAINNSVSAAETAFMNSPGHRANILNANYTEVGLGVRYDSKGSVYVVQEFIKP